MSKSLLGWIPILIVAFIAVCVVGNESPQKMSWWAICVEWAIVGLVLGLRVLIASIPRCNHEIKSQLIPTKPQPPEKASSSLRESIFPFGVRTEVGALLLIFGACLGIESFFEKSQDFSAIIGVFILLVCGAACMRPALALLARSQHIRQQIPLLVRVFESSASAASEQEDEKGPISITVTTNSAIIRFCEETKEATLNALRAEILQGTLCRDTKTSIKFKRGDGKWATWNGTLIQCAWRYRSQLANLYMPVRCHAVAGLGYGVLVGVCILIENLGINVFQVNQQYGMAIMALPVCWLLFWLLSEGKLRGQYANQLRAACCLAILALPVYICSKSVLFFALLGAVTGGGLFFGLLGMAFGAMRGAIRGRHLERAKDAPRENATLRVVIPLGIALLLWWIASRFWAQNYFMGQPWAHRLR